MKVLCLQESTLIVVIQYTYIKEETMPSFLHSIINLEDISDIIIFSKTTYCTVAYYPLVKHRRHRKA